MDIEIAVTVALAVVGGLAALAYRDLAAYKRLCWLLRPILRAGAYVSTGFVLSGLLVVNERTDAETILLGGFYAILGLLALSLVLTLLIWLREGLNGFAER